MYFYDYYDKFHICIYGDGERKYDGYYFVTIDEFDEFYNPTKRNKELYVKAESKIEVREFITHIIKIEMLKAFENHERLTIRKIWEVHSN